ncbi:hypothetical protein ATB93_11095 [Sphingomonas sp. WG]|nr:hypothetical protein ATB93_11095 [Sphingomonas sp. WG]
MQMNLGIASKHADATTLHCPAATELWLAEFPNELSAQRFHLGCAISSKTQKSAVSAFTRREEDENERRVLGRSLKGRFPAAKGGKLPFDHH